jgi:hypothetical protein
LYCKWDRQVGRTEAGAEEAWTSPQPWDGSRHFFGTAAEAMRFADGRSSALRKVRADQPFVTMVSHEPNFIDRRLRIGSAYQCGLPAAILVACVFGQMLHMCG